MTEQLEALEQSLRSAESRRDLLRRWFNAAESEASRLRGVLAFNMPAWAFDLIREWVNEARSNFELAERAVFKASEAITKHLRSAGDITAPGATNDRTLNKLALEVRDARRRVNGDAQSHQSLREARMRLEDYLETLPGGDDDA